jgi:pimeloyl-ACP methyl ester carboxylesterase
VFTALVAAICGCAPACAEEFDSGGVRIHYSVTGQGPPVLLVHGLGSSAMLNWQLPGTVAQLARDHQVISFDSRGHGRSDKPLSEDAYGTQMCEDIVRLLNQLHIQKAQIVGYSLGGFEVMKLLTLHPERVTSAVMCGAAWLRAGSPLDHFWAKVPARSKRAAPAACMRGVSQLAITEAQLKQIKPKVALIVGDRDPCRVMYVEAAHRLRPDWTLYIVRDSGHFNCIFKPEFKNDLQQALAKTR